MKQVLYKILFPFVNKKYNLEGKWWHRLLKVIFTFLIIITFIISLFFYYGTNEKNNFFKGKASGFSLIPTANADNGEQNIIQMFLDDSKTKSDLQSKRNAVIEMLKNGEDEKFIQDTIINKMGYNGITQSETPQEQGFLSKLGISLLLSIISTYIINLFFQIFYYKVILYILYGKI